MCIRQVPEPEQSFRAEDEVGAETVFVSGGYLTLL
jgi:hypothetical protein